MPRFLVAQGAVRIGAPELPDHGAGAGIRRTDPHSLGPRTPKKRFRVTLSRRAASAKTRPKAKMRIAAEGLAKLHIERRLSDYVLEEEDPAKPIIGRR